ncbi:hypothetical protein WA158_007337 [Blastocystis sp. Blastoise]
MTSIDYIFKKLEINDKNVISKAIEIQNNAYRKCTSLGSEIVCVPAASVEIASKFYGLPIDLEEIYKRSGALDKSKYQRALSYISNVLNISIVPSLSQFCEKYKVKTLEKQIQNYLDDYRSRKLSYLPSSQRSLFPMPPYMRGVFLYLVAKKYSITLDRLNICRDSNVPIESFIESCQMVIDLFPELADVATQNKVKEENKILQKEIKVDIERKLQKGEIIKAEHATNEKEYDMIQKTLENVKWKEEVLKKRQMEKETIKKRKVNEKESIDHESQIKSKPKKQLSLLNMFQ